MSANHLKPSKSDDAFYFKCKWTACREENFNTVDDLIKHISFNHLEMSAEEMETPNLCFWKGCGRRFKDFESLTVFWINKTHAAEVHVGTGLHEYVCMWYKCDRNGKPFTQRQKMMRHLQTRFFN